jgi:hypothetical protein
MWHYQILQNLLRVTKKNYLANNRPVPLKTKLMAKISKIMLLALMLGMH